jgi:hypothetical protein
MLTGTGMSKKLAKRQAAHKMWERLQESPISLSSILPGSDGAGRGKLIAQSMY